MTLAPHSLDALKKAFEDTIALHEQVLRGDPTPILAAAEAISSCFRAGGKVLVFGNGGSTADAQHAAAEFVGRFLRDRQALPAIALTADTSILTSVANDEGFERVFARQVEALGRPGDVAIGISTSGGSPNVVAALAAARQRGIVTVAVTGRDGGTAGRSADIHVNVGSDITPRVQEVHRTILHVICDLVERTVVEAGNDLGAGPTR